MAEAKGSRILRGRVEVIVPYNNGELTHVFPAKGPNTYRNVGKQILDDSLVVPNGPQTASLVHSAYFDNGIKDEPESANIRDIMKNRWLWVFQNNLWAPEGVYVADDSKADGSSKSLDASQLERMLKGGKEIKGIRFSKDGSIRFAPKGSYQLGDHTPESLAKNGFVIASYGIKGAEQLGEVASKFRNAPYLYGLDINNDQKPEQRVATLYSNWGNYRLGVDGNYFDYYGYGFAFGVSAKGEASQKI